MEYPSFVFAADAVAVDGYSVDLREAMATAGIEEATDDWEFANDLVDGDDSVGTGTSRDIAASPVSFLSGKGSFAVAPTPSGGISAQSSTNRLVLKGVSNSFSSLFAPSSKADTKSAKDAKGGAKGGSPPKLTAAAPAGATGPGSSSNSKGGGGAGASESAAADSGGDADGGGGDDDAALTPEQRAMAKKVSAAFASALHKEAPTVVKRVPGQSRNYCNLACRVRIPESLLPAGDAEALVKFAVASENSVGWSERSEFSVGIRIRRR